MAPKLEDPKGATTRAASKKEETASIAAQPLEPPSLETKIDRILQRHDDLMEQHRGLATLPSQVADICTRLDALELRSGRSSPSRTPPSSSTAASAPVARDQSPASIPSASVSAQPTTSAQATQPESSTTESTSEPWAAWPSSIRSVLGERLGKHNLSFAKLWKEPESVWMPRSSAASRPDVAATAAQTATRPLFCKAETLGSFDGDPSKLESFISRVHDIGRKRIPGWSEAVLAAVPDALTGHAAKWHASLTKQEVESVNSLDDLFAVMRRAFPINRAQLRTDARQRKWNPKTESAMNYFYDKVLLLRQAFGDTYAEMALAQDVADGLEASMRAYVRLPPENPTLQTLQDALAEWEPVWREVHAVNIVSDTDDKKDAPLMTRSQSEPATHAATPLSAPLPLLPAPPRPPRSEQRAVAPSSPQWSKTSASVPSLSQTYDPSRIVPASNGQPRMYRRPDSSRVMRLNRNCGKCGQSHFDFEHDHLLASGQLRTLTGDYDEVEESELGLDVAGAGASF
ncbi:hypothetical protein OC834_007193 [Tilletia horrida]|nr:hypothetical protein OC834_007193 [Tilletia horrida]